MGQPSPHDPDFFNPYAAPKASINPVDAFLGSSQDFWRDRNLLVVRKGTTFPDRCVRCNAPAEGYRLRRNLIWHHPLIYLVALVNLILYVIVALIVRKTARLEIPLCPEHRARRRNTILIAWGIVLASVPVGIALGQVLPNEQIGLAILAGFVLFLVGAIYGIIAAPPVLPARINDSFAWLKRVCPEWMADLPDYPQAPGG